MDFGDALRMAANAVVAGAVSLVVSLVVSRRQGRYARALAAEGRLLAAWSALLPIGNKADREGVGPGDGAAIGDAAEALIAAGGGPGSAVGHAAQSVAYHARSAEQGWKPTIMFIAASGRDECDDEDDPPTEDAPDPHPVGTGFREAWAALKVAVEQALSSRQ